MNSTRPRQSASTPSSDAVATIRAFNRFYTEAVQVLDDEHLGSGLTFGQARVLYEIRAIGPIDMQTLRLQLDLDAGYLSRTLSALKRAGLVRIDASAEDRRAKRVALTPKGTRKVALLSGRSDSVVSRWLAPLDSAAQTRLVAAMKEIQSLLSAHIEITPASPNSPEAQACLSAYCAELDARFPRGFDAIAAGRADADDITPPNGQFLLVRRLGKPLGCGAVKPLAPEIGEIKRMWLHPKLRGGGLGRRLLHALEEEAAKLGFRRVRLDTSAPLHEAVHLYPSAGYQEIKRYNDNPYATHWYEKQIAEGQAIQ